MKSTLLSAIMILIGTDGRARSTINWELHRGRFPVFLLPALLAFAVQLAGENCAATTVQYDFSGTFDFSDPAVLEGGQPLSDYLPQLTGVTSFTGSFGYQYASDQVLVPNTIAAGASTLHIDSLFGGLYPIGRAAPAPVESVVISSDFISFELGNFGNPGNPPIVFQPDVFIENLQVQALYDTLPNMLSDVDLTSPDVTGLRLRIRLKVSNGQGGFLTPVNTFPILSISFVPEPSSFALCAVAACGLIAVRRKR